MKKLDYKWIALIVTTIGSLIAAIDSTIVILALPRMIQDLHSNLVVMTWVIVGYLIATTLLLLTFGRMADMFGRVRMYNLGFAVFTLGSLLCGLALNDYLLIVFRVLQGIGGSMLTTNAMVIITEVFPAEQRGQAMGINAITWGAGCVLGPVLGGLILAATSWRWIFFVNVPIGVGGTIAAYLLLHDIAPNPRGERFDWIGAGLFSVGLLSLLIWILNGIGPGWFSAEQLPYFVVALLGSIGFFLWERRAAHPILDVSLFTNRPYAFAVLPAGLQTLAVFAVNFLVIFYFQGVRGYDPLTAALLILPLPVLTSVIGPFGGYWADKDRYGGMTPAIVGMVVQIAGLILLIFLTTTTSYLFMAMTLGLMGIGGALFWSPITSATMGVAPRNRLGVASATLSTLRNIGMVCSFAVALAVAAASMPPALVNDVFLRTVGQLQPAIASQFTSAMTHAFVASAVICILGLILSLLRDSKRQPTRADIATTTPAEPATEHAH